MLVACEGPERPIGPAGPQGTVGAQGPQGVAGAQGQPGTANVIYSNWISSTFTASGTNYTATISAPSITQAVLDSADIRLYWKEFNRVLSLPYAQTLGGVTYTIHQRFYVGKIELVANYALSTQEFRYIIIPGGTKAGRRSANESSDYEQVKYTYLLPD
jgi:hypothetical protein